MTSSDRVRSLEILDCDVTEDENVMCVTNDNNDVTSAKIVALRSSFDTKD